VRGSCVRGSWVRGSCVRGSCVRGSCVLCCVGAELFISMFLSAWLGGVCVCTQKKKKDLVEKYRGPDASASSRRPSPPSPCPWLLYFFFIKKIKIKNI